jgi:protein-tyrosine phosphatase
VSEPPFRILVVCIGNVCRSPLIERLLRLRLAPAGGAFEISSAGVHAMVGSAMHADAAPELVRLGGDPAGFTARQLLAGHVEASDLVLTATRDVRAAVLALAPVALRRTFTLRELAALAVTSDATSLPALLTDCARRRATAAREDLDVPDPMGRSREVHTEAATIAAEAVDQLTPVLLRLAGVLGAN